MLTAYFDEAGRTGKQYFKDSQWNFHDQPYFGLGALVIRPENYSSLVNDIQNRIKSENYQGEFKWSNKLLANRSGKIIPDLCEIIKKYECSIFIEIEDKLFTFTKLMTDYLVLPYYETAQIPNRSFACILIANYLYEYLPPQVTSDIGIFLDGNSQDTELLKKHVRSIHDNISNEFIKTNCLDTIDSIERFEKGEGPFQLRNLFPLPNFNSSGESQTCITPHIDCYNGILVRIADSFPFEKSCECIHDNILELRTALENETKQFSRIKRSTIDFSISFVDSKEEILTSTIDYILGAVLQTVKSLVSGATTYQALNECYQDLIFNCVNFVSSFDNQLLLFPKNEQILSNRAQYQDFKVIDLT